MTNEEKQEIVAAVLSAIRTNSVRITDLTEVQETNAGSYIEISGGKRISADNLKAIIQAAIIAASVTPLAARVDTLQNSLTEEATARGDADQALQNAVAVLEDNMFSDFDSVESDTQITLVIALDGGGTSNVVIGAVTSVKAGLMTPAMLAALNGAVSDILQQAQMVLELYNMFNALDFSTAGITEGGTTQEAINVELRKGIKSIGVQYGDATNIVLETEKINGNEGTVSIPSATPQAAGAMSAEQAALLADLSGRVDALEAGKATFSLSASPSSMWYGETKDITLTAIASMTASSITIKKGSTTVNTGSNVASLSYADNDVSTSQSYSATAVIKGTTKNASASVSIIYPKYIGAGMVYGDVVTLANRVSTVTGNHQVEITQSGQRIFIVTDVTINKVISDNFEVPMTRTTTTMNGKTYYIYQSDTLVPYTFNLVIS